MILPLTEEWSWYCNAIKWNALPGWHSELLCIATFDRNHYAVTCTGLATLHSPEDKMAEENCQNVVRGRLKLPLYNETASYCWLPN
jgi:hypothetical protein